jgi:hypothetical protein
MNKLSTLFYHFTARSSNTKTGPIPVTTTSADSCPDSCPLKFTIEPDTGEKKPGPCYANWGPISWFWAKVTKGVKAFTLSWDELIVKVKAIGPGQLWRHDQAGDLPGVNEHLDTGKVRELTAANGDSRGFTYTHKKKALLEQPGALQAVLDANRDGFTINISCDTAEEIDHFEALGLPTVITVPMDAEAFTTPGGRRVKNCPAILEDRHHERAAKRAGVSVKEYNKAHPLFVDCNGCELCQDPARRNSIAFPAHGVKARLVQLSPAA